MSFVFCLRFKVALPAPRYVDPKGAVEALHGGANRRLQLVDVQPSVQGLQAIYMVGARNIWLGIKT